MAYCLCIMIPHHKSHSFQSMSPVQHAHVLKEYFLPSSRGSQCSPTRLHHNVTSFSRCLIEYPEDIWNIIDKALTMTVL